MVKTWTNQQKSAINSRDSNLLVAAAAGSGKTAVLVQRIVKKVTKENVEIDNLLVVTFTNAAAAEMRERIGEAIISELDNNPRDKNLQRQLALLNRSNITTIHSFCLEIIRNNFEKIGIDPGFRISDETENQILKEEAMEEVLEEFYEVGDKNFLKLVDSFGGKRDDSGLKIIIDDLYRFIMSNPWPKKWLENSVENFNIGDKSIDDIELYKNFKKSVSNDFLSYEELLKSAYSMVVDDEYLFPYGETLKEDLENLFTFKEIFEGKHSFDEIKESLESIKPPRLKRGKKGNDKSLADDVKFMREDFKTFIKKLSEDYFFESEENNILIINDLYMQLNALKDITIFYMDRYAEKKKENTLLDFSDLEHFALEILTKNENGKIKPSEVSRYYKEKFDEVLVDEYQDSNEIQEVIIKMVSRIDDENPNVFMVGDVKQSIYRFRQAKPELFLEKYKNYPTEVSSKDKRNKKILLYKNFRSRKNVLSTVNFIFESIMSSEVGEIEYDEKESLTFGANYYGEEIKDDPFEILLLDRSLEENSFLEDDDTYLKSDFLDIDIEDFKEIELEAKMVANKIESLIDSKQKIFDKKNKVYRNIKYKDIVILLRATRNKSDIFIDELKTRSIPCFSDNELGYFDSIEIRTMVSLLKIIDNPLQDIPLLSVLRSPIFSFSEDDLVEIRDIDKTEYFYNNLKSFKSSSMNKNLILKVDNFNKKLLEYRNISRYMDLGEFIWYLYSETSYYDFVGAMPGGVERQANLKVLFQRAKQFEDTSLKGLFNFIIFLDKIKSTTGDIGAAKILGENENLVRIMSIHKSKGLEFPVVILSNANKGFNKMDTRKPIILHEELGFGPKYVNVEKNIENTTFIREIIKKKIDIENMSEEMRVLYVALTRAEEKVIVTGSIKSAENDIQKWKRLGVSLDTKINPNNVLKSGSYLDWIMMSILKEEDFYDNDSLISGENFITNSKFTCRVLSSSDIIYKAIENMKKEEFIDLRIKDYKKPEQAFMVNKILSYEYRYKGDIDKASKMTVTEIKKIRENKSKEEIGEELIKEEFLLRPRFMTEKKLTGAERGSAFHKVMMYLDFQKTNNIEEIENNLESILDRELISREEKDAVDKFKILSLFKSKLGKRIVDADKMGNLEREKSFFINGEKNEEGTMIVGAIDLFFEEDGELIIVDYKTDYIPKDLEDDYKEFFEDRYKLQLSYYKDALERITLKKVKSCYIYSIFLEKEIIIL
ncbi:MAG: helicase-exonuclease AddAB subunit AddA [Clostridium sp.]|nr:helicase-exonuclease AddAB subunit AddA [Clostridium sp.]